MPGIPRIALTASSIIAKPREERGTFSFVSAPLGALLDNEILSGTEPPKVTGAVETEWGTGYDDGDIIGIALDLDND